MASVTPKLRTVTSIRRLRRFDGRYSASSSSITMSSPSATMSTWRIVQIAICANLGGLLVGIHLALFSGILEMPHFASALAPRVLTPFAKSFLTTILMAIFTLAATPAGTFTARYGRRPALLLSAALFLLSPILTILLPTSFHIIVITRALAGLAYALANITCPMYTAEIAPPHLRGTLVNLYQLAVTVGIVYTQLCNLAFSSGPWTAPVALAALPAALMLLAVWAIVPESPTWLTSQMTSSTTSIDTTRDVEADAHVATPTLRSLLMDPSSRRRLTIGAALGAAQQWSGINAVIFFAPALVGDVLQWTGAQANMRAAVAIGVANLLATIAAVVVADRLPRRLLLLGGGPPMALGLISLGAMRDGLVSKMAPVAIMSLLVYVVAFAMTYGPLPFVVAAEIFPLEYKALGMSFCTMVLGVSSMFIGFTFLPMLKAVGGSVYFLYAGCLVLSSWFIWTSVPETRNLSLEQIDDLLEGKGNAGEGGWGKKSPPVS